MKGLTRVFQLLAPCSSTSCKELEHQPVIEHEEDQDTVVVVTVLMLTRHETNRSRGQRTIAHFWIVSFPFFDNTYTP